MATNLTLGKDQNKEVAFFRPPSDEVDAMFLGVDTNESWTVPATTNFVILNSTENFYCRVDGVAAIPTTEVADGSGSELNPTNLDVSAATTLQFIAPAACIITIARYG